MRKIKRLSRRSEDYTAEKITYENMYQKEDEFSLEEVTYKPQETEPKTDLVLKAETRKKRFNLNLFVIAITANLLTFASGTSIAWVAPALIKLNRNGTDNPLEYPISYVEASWIAGLLPLGGSLGPLVAGRIADRIGRKSMLIAIGCIQVVSLIMLIFSKTIVLYYISRFISGVSVGSTFSVQAMFLAEISENHNRGAIGCLVGIFSACGTNFSLIVGPYLTLQNFNLVLSAPLFIFLSIFCLVSPETPTFLASRNKTKNLIDALNKLRTKTTSEINIEMTSIIETVNRGKSRTSIKELFRSKVSRKGFIIAAGLLIFQQSSGLGGIISYMPAIFKASNSHLSPEVNTMIIGTFQVIGTILATIVVDRLGRRILLLLSSIGMSFTLATLGTYFYLKDKQVPLEWCSWLPVICLIVFILAFSVGFGPVPWTVMAEMFLPNVRATAASIASFLCFMSTFIVTLAFPYLSLYLGMAGCFLLFTVISTAAIFFIYFKLPETKGKSIQEIQQLLIES